MGRSRRGFMWMSIILELSLIMGIGLYGLIHPHGRANEGGLIRSTEVDPSLSPREEEIITDEDHSPTEEGGPYVVAPLFHVSTYRAKSGDSLWTIAKENGPYFYTLLSVNRLKKANEISIGQELKLPNQCGILHTVHKGETLEDIALKYDVSIRKIIRVNRILDPNKIKQGSDLFVPEARVSHAFSRELLRNSGVPPQFAWPCRKSQPSSGFGYRKDPFTGRRSFHSGADFAPGYGASVYASMGGIVTYAGWMGGYGKLIVIQHSKAYSTRYGHLSRILVKKGKRVRQRQRIGYIGNTGRSTGAHLHFEIRENGKPINPMRKLK
jgi:LysM repeat protein